MPFFRGQENRRVSAEVVPENQRLFRFGHFTFLMKHDRQDAYPC